MRLKGKRELQKRIIVHTMYNQPAQLTGIVEVRSVTKFTED